MIQNLSSWLPLLVTILTILGGIAAYGFQKRKDRDDVRRHERRQLYVALVDKIRLADASTLNQKWNEQHSHYLEWLSHEAALLIASPDNVALELRELRKRYLVYLHTFQKSGYKHDLYLHFADQFYRVVLEMRKDVLETNALAPELKPEALVEHLRDANIGMGLPPI